MDMERQKTRIVVDLDPWVANKLEAIRHTIRTRNIERPFEEQPERATYKAIVQRGVAAVYRELVDPTSTT